jgi:large subunit ribosomal protein L4
MEAKVYNKEGKEAGKVRLPESVFGAPWNSDLVHQVVTSMQANARTPVAHTKDRSEVRGGGRKPWRQKGTGRARHGSIRSPLWVGGGATFGPRNDKKYGKKINKKMRTRALYTVLSRKLKDGEVLFVDDLSFSEPKAKEAKELLSKLGNIKGFNELSAKKKNSALITLSEVDKNSALSFRNFGNIYVEETRNLNPVSALKYKYLIITKPQDSIKLLEGRSEDKKK